MLSIEDYKLSEAKEKDLLEKAVIIFDTSALLDFYYYSEKTKKDIFENVFTKLEKRLWIPAQVYFEFSKNREKVLLKPIQTYHNLLDINKNNKDSGHIKKINNLINDISSIQLKSIKSQMQTLIEKTKNDDKHPFLDELVFSNFNEAISKFNEDVDTLVNNFKQFEQEIQEKVQKKIGDIEKNIEIDTLFNQINKVFEIGEDFTHKEILEIVEEGMLRYKNQIPPGYEDEEDKSGFQIYGDLIAWKQILKHMENSKIPTILVSNDEKEDWIEEDGESKKPRFELIKEYKDSVGNQFWMYNSNSFFKKINSILDKKLESSVIDEVQEVQETKNNSTINKDLVRNWLDSYFNHAYEITEISDEDNSRPNETVFAAKEHNEDKVTLAIYAFKSSKTNYTALLNPLRDAIELKNVFQKRWKDVEVIFVFLASNEGRARTFSKKHLTRTKIQEILKENSIGFRVVIGYINEKDDMVDIIYDR